MSILSTRSNNLFSIGNCPECLMFCEQKKRLYEQDPTAMDRDLKQLEDRGVVRVNSNKKELTLTLIMKKGEQKIREVEIEGVDHLQCLFFISHMEGLAKNGCSCELSCCVLNRLSAILS